jgi:hypothetical protein
MFTLSIAEGLALSALHEGFAQGVVYLHAACPERNEFFAPRVLHRGRRAHLPVPKSLAAKSRVSISSKLIEIKGLQLHYFGHLRKTGGRGSYGHPTRDVHPEPVEGLFSYSTLPHLNRNSPPLSPIILDIRQRMSTLSLPKGSSLTKSNHSRTYAIPGGGGSGHTREERGIVRRQLVAPASCRPGQGPECLPAGCRRYMSEKRAGQGQPLQ